MANAVAMRSPWRVCTWTDERGREVRELAFHESELEQVLALPLPRGAVAREPVMMLTSLARAKPYRWHGLYPGRPEIHRPARQQTFRGPDGVTLVLDPAQHFPDDPGNGTPVMVHWGGGSSTFWCAQNEGTVVKDTARSFEELMLPAEVSRWLNDEADGLVDEWFAVLAGR